MHTIEGRAWWGEVGLYMAPADLPKNILLLDFMEVARVVHGMYLYLRIGPNVALRGFSNALSLLYLVLLKV